MYKTKSTFFILNNVNKYVNPKACYVFRYKKMLLNTRGALNDSRGNE